MDYRRVDTVQKGLNYFQCNIFTDNYFVILICGDVHPHPGPSHENSLKFCHWNLDSIAVNDFIKIPLIEAYNSVYNYDLIALSETYLDSSISNGTISLTGFSKEIFRCDHPDDVKRGGVCLFYKDNLAIKQRKDLQVMDECIISELTIGRKKVFFVVVYRSPSQNAESFHSFLDKLETTIQTLKDKKPQCIILTGDFNCRSDNWWVDDEVTSEGTKLSEVIDSYCLNQLIDEPTHILPNSLSCIDLIITDQPNLFVDFGVHPSLYPKSHHQIIFGTINLSVPRPPPYKRTVWKYDKAEIGMINTELRSINWSKRFDELDVDQAVDSFTTSLMSVITQHIPNREITCCDRDAPWITDEVKKAIKRKHRVYRKYVKRGRKPDDWTRVKQIKTDTAKMITDAKNKYYTDLGKRLCDPSVGIKTYWRTLHKIINKKQVMSIPPILLNGVFITNFQNKANLFNDFFVQQCSVLRNDSALPNMEYRTVVRKSNVSITEDKIVNIIRKLNSNKAHGCDNMSIRMLKICDTTIAEPLKLIYEKCLDTGRYPRLWKKAIIVPAHKKNSRQILKNYRPISLLPICGKIFEKIIFDEIYEHLTATKLLSEKQSGFRPGDSTINQLLSITHEIYNAFEHHHDTRAVFLDISKAFDKVWHEGLLLKLRSNGISGPLLNLLSEFLSERYQRTVLNGKSSDWRMITAGVPQGSVLGPLLFLVYINDLADNLISDVRLFADDTSLFHVVTDADISADVLNHDLKAIENWAFQWKMSFNPDPTKQAEQVTFSSKSIRAVHPPIYFNNSAVVTVPHHKHIGLVLDESLTFAEHIKEAVIKARRGIGIIRFMARYVHRDVLDQMYKLYVRPHLDYGDIIYHNQNLHLMSKLESTQYDAALAVSGAWRGTNTDKVFEELGWETLAHRRWYRRLCQFYKIENNSCPEYLKTHLPERRENPYNLRRPNIFPEVRAKTNRYSNSFYPYCIKAWNNLDPAIRCLPTISQFKKAVVQLIRPRKKHLFGIDDIAGTRLLTRLRVDFSDLRLHKFNHRFNCDSPMCTCGRGFESVEHFFLQCQFYADQRGVLIDSVSEVIGNEVQVYPEQHLCCIFLYGSESFNSVANKMILESTIRYIKDTKRFKT